MKRILCFLGLLVILFSFCSCKKSQDDATDNGNIVSCYFPEETCHQFMGATCNSPSKCRICGLEEGEPLGHLTTHGYCDRCNSFVFAKDKIGIIDGYYSLKLELPKRIDLSLYQEKTQIDKDGNIINYILKSNQKNEIESLQFADTTIELPCNLSNLEANSWKVRKENYSQQTPTHTFSMGNYDAMKILTAYGRGPQKEFDKIMIHKVSQSFTNEKRPETDSIKINGIITEDTSLDDILLTLGAPTTIKLNNINPDTLISLIYPVKTGKEDKAWLEFNINSNYGTSIDKIISVTYYIDNTMLNT